MSLAADLPACQDGQPQMDMIPEIDTPRNTDQPIRGHGSASIHQYIGTEGCWVAGSSISPHTWHGQDSKGDGISGKVATLLFIIEYSSCLPHRLYSSFSCCREIASLSRRLKEEKYGAKDTGTDTTVRTHDNRLSVPERMHNRPIR